MLKNPKEINLPAEVKTFKFMSLRLLWKFIPLLSKLELPQGRKLPCDGKPELVTVDHR